MGSLLWLNMKEYEIKLRAVFAWCMACEWSVSDLYMLFNKLHAVIHYERIWTDADTPETTALAAWSRDVALEDLVSFMRARCFPDEIRMAVMWLSNHT